MVGFTEEEERIYDRQIRLWGVETQKRLNDCHVLIVGLTGPNIEAAKNLILAGIRVTLSSSLSGKAVALDPSHSACNFFKTPEPSDADGVPASDPLLVTVNGMKSLNPMVRVEPLGGGLNGESLDLFSAVVIGAEVVSSWSDLIALDLKCREKGKGLFITLICKEMGAGVIITDMGRSHEVVNRKNDKLKYTVEYPSIEEIKQLDELPKEGRRGINPKLIQLHQTLFKRELCGGGVITPAVAAILGGITAQQVQLFISRNDSDGFKNVFIFDETCECLVFSINIRKALVI